MTPWEVFNGTAELSFWAEALQTVGFAGAALQLLICNKPHFQAQAWRDRTS